MQHTGHSTFRRTADPAARTCRATVPPEQLGDDFPGNEFLVLECRREFVITSLDELEK